MKYSLIRKTSEATEERITYERAVEILSAFYRYKTYDDGGKYVTGIPQMLAEEGILPFTWGYIKCEGEPLRICDVCGEPMTDGYFVGVSFLYPEYFCSDECLHKVYTEEEYLRMYDEDEAFYTTWWDAYPDDELPDF